MEKDDDDDDTISSQDGLRGLYLRIPLTQTMHHEATITNGKFISHSVLAYIFLINFLPGGSEGSPLV